MFYIKNAIKNIYRYKSKYIIFGILYFILILAASVCGNIFMRINFATDNLLREIGGVARFVESRLSPDQRDLLMNEREDFLMLKDLEHIDDVQIFKHNLVTHYFSSYENPEIDSLEIELDINGEILKLSGGEFLPNYDFLSTEPGYELPAYKSVFVLGYNMSLINLAKNEFNIEKGRMFENDGEAVISINKLSEKDANDWNRLDLGDKIIIKNDNGVFKEFEIVGIQTQNPDDDMNTNRRMIYTTLESSEYFRDFIMIPTGEFHNISPVENLIGKSIYYSKENNPANIIFTGYDVLVYLNSYDNLFAVSNTIENMDDYTGMIVPLFSDFGVINSLIKNLWAWSVIFLVLIAFIIVCVTIISTIILLNSRKYEVAVMRSVGMKKSRLIINYLIENLVFVWGISVVSLIIAQFIAPILTENIFIGMKDLVSAETFENLTRVSTLEIWQNIGLVFGGTTAVVMLSLILACINIVRFEPLKIFNKQY